MKKIKVLQSGIAAILLLCAVFCQAQTKIGSITIDDVTAKKYFADCYLRPDTISAEQEYGLPSEWGVEENRKIRDRNAELERRSIGMCRGRFLIPRKPSEIDFIKWLAVSAK